MTDEQIVQPEATSEGEASTEPTEAQPQLSVEEQVAKAMEGQLETFSRKMQSQSDRVLARIQREAETTASVADSALANMDADLDTEVAKPRPRARAQHLGQLQMRRQQEQQMDQAVEGFDSTLTQYVQSLGIDPNDKNIDWAKDASLPNGMPDFQTRQAKILASVGKLQKENAELAVQKAEDRFRELETNLRKELELDKVDTTASAGGGGGSDAEFLKKFGSGDVPYTKENEERAKKLMK